MSATDKNDTTLLAPQAEICIPECTYKSMLFQNAQYEKNIFIILLRWWQEWQTCIPKCTNRIWVPKCTIRNMPKCTIWLNNILYHKIGCYIMKCGYKKKRLTVPHYSSINGTKKLMIFTNTNKMINAATTHSPTKWVRGASTSQRFAHILVNY